MQQESFDFKMYDSFQYIVYIQQSIQILEQ